MLLHYSIWYVLQVKYKRNHKHDITFTEADMAVGRNPSTPGNIQKTFKERLPWGGNHPQKSTVPELLTHSDMEDGLRCECSESIDCRKKQRLT